MDQGLSEPEKQQVGGSEAAAAKEHERKRHEEQRLWEFTMSADGNVDPLKTPPACWTVGKFVMSRIVSPQRNACPAVGGSEVICDPSLCDLS